MELGFYASFGLLGVRSFAKVPDPVHAQIDSDQEDEGERPILFRPAYSGQEPYYIPGAGSL